MLCFKAYVAFVSAACTLHALPGGNVPAQVAPVPAPYRLLLVPGVNRVGDAGALFVRGVDVRAGNDRVWVPLSSIGADTGTGDLRITGGGSVEVVSEKAATLTPVKRGSTVRIAVPKAKGTRVNVLGTAVVVGPHLPPRLP